MMIYSELSHALLAADSMAKLLGTRSAVCLISNVTSHFLLFLANTFVVRGSECSQNIVDTVRQAHPTKRDAEVGFNAVQGSCHVVLGFCGNVLSRGAGGVLQFGCIQHGGNDKQQGLSIIGGIITMAFRAPSVGAYRSLADGQPGPTSVAECWGPYGILDTDYVSSMIQMAHEGGGSFHIPIRHCNSPLLLPFLQVTYRPVTSSVMMFCVEEKQWNLRTALRLPHFHEQPTATPEAAAEDAAASTDRSDVSDVAEVYATSVRVLQYNVFLRPSAVSKDGQAERAARIPAMVASYIRRGDDRPSAVRSSVAWFTQRLPSVRLVFSDRSEVATESDVELLNADIVIVNEAFAHFNTLAEGFVQGGFPYFTDPIQGGIALNGGIFVFSRHQIISVKHYVYPSAKGSDALVSKGIVYAKIRKRVAVSEALAATKIVHVFATHLQAWEYTGAVAARRRQLQMLRLFSRRVTIPHSDLVIFAGDFNLKSRESAAEATGNPPTEAAAQQNSPEFDGFLRQMQVHLPKFCGGAKGTQTPDNELAGRDGGTFSSSAGDWIDYIFCSALHSPNTRQVGMRLLRQQNVGRSGTETRCETDAADHRSTSPRTPKFPLGTPDESSSSEEVVLGFLEVLPDFKATHPFPIDWSRWVAEKRHIRDLSDHYPVFTEFDWPIYSNECELAASADEGTGASSFVFVDKPLQ